MKNVYILTLNWQGKDKLEKLIPSLLPNLNNLNWKWLIRDHASTDGSIDYIKSFNNPNIIVFPWPDNKQNFSQGVNFLFKESAAKDDDIIILLNNDIIFRDNKSINSMLKLLDNKTTGIVGAKLNYTGTNLIQHAGVLFGSIKLPFHWRSKQSEQPRDCANRLFPAVTGALLATKAEVFQTAGKLNESFKFSFEDVSYNCYVKYKLKLDIVYCGNTQVDHEESASLKKNPMHKLYFKHNAKVFLDEWAKYINPNETTEYNNVNYNILK